MKGLFVLALVLISCIIPVFGQPDETYPGVGLTELSQLNQTNSYATFPTDLGNIEPLWFEVNIIPNFYLRQSKNSRLMAVLTPQIILRMYQERSYPVRTPSYMPQLTLYYLLKEKDRYRKYSVFARYAHHSNGQDGDFFEENGEINLKTGDFATNFIESGIIITNVNPRYYAHQFFKSSFEVHPQSWSVAEMEGIYANYRWHNALSIYRISPKNTEVERKKANFSVKAETSWMFGELNDWDGFSLKRLNLTLTFYYHPKFLEDIGFFAQYYRGLDYYNIYFSHRLEILRFGLMTEKLRF